MKYLFTPFEIKTCNLKNRIVMPAVASFMLRDDGSITDEMIEHYRLRAAGGVSMVIMEACAVSPDGIVSPRQARIYDDCFLEGLSKIAEAMRSEGAVPAIQIHHAGRQTSGKIIKQKPFAPSPLPCPTIRGDVEPLSIEKIRGLVQKFGDAASRAIEAGFELIEIHGAHGYLVSQFLSPFSNIRDDEYGKDVRGRSRFAVEIVKEVRKRVGDAFPISFKISAQEFVPGGLDIKESVQILRLLADAGVDIVQVSAGSDSTPEWICQPMFMKKACLADSAWKIKNTLDIPVMAVGRINDPMVAEEILEEGKADLVCMGRGLLADPELPQKAKEGRFGDIRTCIACNTCIESIFRKGKIECLVNPGLGREKDLVFKPAEVPRKIMIVGGGPGGMSAAWTTAKRGHDVHLFEKQTTLGGLLLLGSVIPHKKELSNLIRFQERQMERFGVACHLDHEVTLEIVEEEKPDVVILATGSSPSVPAVDGIGKPIVTNYIQVLIDKNLAGRKTVIIGGGATGGELALYLSDHGCEITIVEMLPGICLNLESMTRKILLRKLKERQVRIIKEKNLINVENDGVVVMGKDQKKRFLEADRVVLATGNKSNTVLYEQIKSLGYEIHRIGDCLEPRSAREAIHEGTLLGYSI